MTITKITMTPEEIVNQEIWAVLQDIREHYQLNTRKEGDVKCILPDFKRAKNISPDRTGDILRFLEKKGAFEIRGFTNERRNAKYLIINPTRFEEIYRQYESINTYKLDDEGLPIKGFLSAKLDITDIGYDEEVKKTMEYIETERENILYEGKIPEKTYIVFAPVSGGRGIKIHNFNVGKFLVFLERNDIVGDLHWPIFIKESENKEVIEIKSQAHVWMDAEYAIKEAIQSPDKFRNEIPRLKIKNWGKFLEVKEQFKNLEKQRKQPEEKNNFEELKEQQGEYSNDFIRIQTKAGLLVFNKNTGFAKLGDFEATENLNPQGKEAVVLSRLMNGKNYQATYSELLGENISKTNKRNLGFVIRNVKKTLGILPKKSAQNEDCIKNIKRYGYRITT